LFNFNFSIITFTPALIFFVLNVFIPGPNVLNTIATSMGSGRSAGIACAFATGLGVILTALVALFGAAILFYKIPVIYTGLTILGSTLLLLFAKRYIQKSLSSSAKLVALSDIDKKTAFQQAFLVLMSNPKMMTTWLAVISLFPVVAGSFNNIITFSLMAGIASFTGHLIFATVFSTRLASRIYMSLYKPINALVGAGFIFYAFKLILSII
jgi:threonine/homoserine/homoserine lactone efflux protein